MILKKKVIEIEAFFRKLHLYRIYIEVYLFVQLRCARGVFDREIVQMS